jgi:hypothetical protein
MANHRILILVMEAAPCCAPFRQRVEDIPRGALVWVTFFNVGYSDLMRNWVAHVRQLQVGGGGTDGLTGG